ncbi:MAG: DUF3168 domain-containing protein [Alphaproteobacteria bacterium]
MSSDTFWHLQAALHTHLAQNTALCALLAAGAGSLYDAVPRDAAFPYIVIGAMQARPEDTQTHKAYDVSLRLHCYSRGEGQREVKRILSALSDAMQNGAINIAGHLLVLCRETGSAAVIETDGETRHATADYRLIVEPMT